MIDKKLNENIKKLTKSLTRLGIHLGKYITNKSKIRNWNKVSKLNMSLNIRRMY